VTAAVALLAVTSPILSGVSSAQATAPPWEPDPNAAPPYGNIQLFDANGVVITSGSVSSQAFAYAAATTAPDSGSTKATVYWRDPQSGASNPPATWSGPQESYNTPFTPPPAGTPATLVADAASAPVALMYSTATVNSWLSGVTPSTTAGYADTIQVILQDTAINGDTDFYWSTDIAYNTGSSAITVDGTNVPADTWVQLFPFSAAPKTTPKLALSAPGPLSAGTSETLTATDVPTATAGLVVFEDNGSAIDTASISAGKATYTYIPAQGSHAYTASYVPDTAKDETHANTATATQVSSATSTTVDLTVTAASSVTVTSASPDALGQGAKGIKVTITGTGFVSGAKASSSNTGLTFGSTTFVSSTEITAKATVKSTATTGAETLTVKDPSGATGSCSTCLVIDAGPVITSVSPATLAPGAATTVTFTGTGFATEVKLKVSGTGITISKVKFVNATDVTALFTVSPSAASGTYTVTMTNHDDGVTTTTVTVS
jgi:hypothetical protein